MFACDHTLAARPVPTAPCNLFVVVPYRNDHADLDGGVRVAVNTLAWWNGETRDEAAACDDPVLRPLLEMTGAYTLRVRIAGDWLYVDPANLSDVPYVLCAWCDDYRVDDEVVEVMLARDS